MNVLLIGSGGREHALCWKILQSKELTKLHAIPGSDAIAKEGAECHANIDSGNHNDILAFCTVHNIDLVVIGPEAPLVKGLADKLAAAGISVFGPSQEAAKLEGSKAYMKDLCMKYGIPTAAYGRFTNIQEAKNYLEQKGLPIVIKADGLAAGKGVIIAQTKAQAEATIEDMLEHNRFGASGAEIVIEEFIDGEEVSVFALCDGQDVVLFGSAQDHKAAYDGDQGPNTGGMGAYSPAHMMSDALEQEVMTRIIAPTIKAMNKEGTPFKGVLFAGLMLTPKADGTKQIKLLEYNVRFGDPECQTLMMRLKNDILPILKACADGALASQLQSEPLSWSPNVALCVVMAANGYPDKYEKDTELLIPAGVASQDDDTKIFHAGTKHLSSPVVDKELWANIGGRVLGCTALGYDYKTAQQKAYDLVTEIEWPQGFCRTDIGYRAVSS